MKQDDDKTDEPLGLPQCADDYIAGVVKKMRGRRRARRSVRSELVAHFEDELKDCQTPPQREEKARGLIEGFGDAKLLAVLCRRAKKHCRPLWAKAVVRTLQVLGIVCAYSLICCGRLFIGAPTVKVDYVARLSEQVRQGRDESLNAKPYFDEAGELADAQPSVYEILTERESWWPGDMNEPQRQAVAELLEKGAEALDVLSRGVTKPGYWRDYRPPAGRTERPSGQGPSLEIAAQGLTADVLAGVMPSLSHYKRLAQKLALRAGWRAWQGDLEGACGDCLSLHRIGWHMEGRGLLIEQMVGTAIEGLARGTILTIADRADIPADLLGSMQQSLQEQFSGQDVVLCLEAEKIFWYDSIQRTFTDDGVGDGRPLKAALGWVAADWKDGLLGLVTFSYPGRREMMRKIDAFYDETELLRERPPWQAGRGDEAERLKKIVADSFLLHAVADSAVRLGHLAWRTRTGRRALVTILALLRYRKDKGIYPDDLDTLLAEAYVREIPIDPYSGRPMGYRKTADGFLLYSWGENLADDGGRLGMGPTGKPRMWAPNDWVFWPVVRAQD